MYVKAKVNFQVVQNTSYEERGDKKSASSYYYVKNLRYSPEYASAGYNPSKMQALQRNWRPALSLY
jgi:hypothetical protein